MRFHFLHQEIPSPSFAYFPSLINSTSPIKKILKSQPTPFFITQKSIVNNRLQALQKSLQEYWPYNSKIAYSFKTNYDIAQNLKFDFCEVVSENELHLAVQNGYKYKNIIFNGPNKGNIINLLDKPITINLDNSSELEQIIKYGLAIKSKIGLRLNSNIHPSRFGFNIEFQEAKNAIAILKKNKVELSGIHFHLGSDIQNPASYHQCSMVVSKFIQENKLNQKLKYIDFGGGFPSHGLVPKTNNQPDPDISTFIKSVTLPLNQIPSNQPQLILEPGRFLVDDATILISRIINVKDKIDSQEIITDATINMLPSAWYRKLLTKTFHHDLSEIVETRINTSIFGSTCQETDLLFQGKLPKLTPADLVVFFCVGAYNQCQASDFIFQKPNTFFIK